LLVSFSIRILKHLGIGPREIEPDQGFSSIYSLRKTKLAIRPQAPSLRYEKNRPGSLNVQYSPPLTCFTPALPSRNRANP
jgi:hypothetical protein